MPATTPTRVAHTADRVCAISSTTTIGITAGWAVELWADRPHLTLMLFGMTLAVAVVAGVATVLARCHASMAEAFVAGHATGRASVGPPAPRSSVSLRVVD